MSKKINTSGASKGFVADPTITPFPINWNRLNKIRFEDAPSDYILLCKLAEKYNEVVDSTNSLEEAMEQFITWANSELEETAINKMNEWLEDGTLANALANLVGTVRYAATTVGLLDETNLSVGALYITSGYSEFNDGFGGVWYVDNQQREDSIQLSKADNILTLIIEHDFNLGQIGNSVTDLDVLLPILLTDDMNINFNGAHLSVTYGTNYYECSNVSLDFTDCTITAKGPYKATAGAMLSIRNSSNIHVIGGIWNANVSQNTETSNREQCHVLNMLNDTNVVVENCELSYASGDGIQFGTQTSADTEGSLFVKNCYIHDVSRNGISVLSSNHVEIKGTSFSNITADPYNESMPLCLIDVEPFINTQKIGTIIIEECSGSSAGGIGVYKGADGGMVYIRKCNVNSIQFRELEFNKSVIGHVEISDCTLKNTLTFSQNSVFKVNVMFDKYNQGMYNVDIANVNNLVGEIYFMNPTGSLGAYRITEENTNTGSIELFTNTSSIRQVGSLGYIISDNFYHKFQGKTYFVNPKGFYSVGSLTH